MRKSQFAFPRAYRLKPIARREGHDAPISHLQIGASRQGVLVPYSPKLDYIVSSSSSGALPITSPDFRVEALGILPSLWARLRLAFFFKKNKYLKYEQFSVFPQAKKPSASALHGTNATR
jgi:hypothetical protein